MLKQIKVSRVMQHVFVRGSFSFALGLFVGIITFSFPALAQFPAPCAPPGCNVSKPLNESAEAQIKTGNLQLSGLDAGGNPRTYGLLVQYGRVGIGTLTPTAKLHVVGSVSIQDGTQGAGKVLTSDSSGNAYWATSTAGFSITDYDYYTINVRRNTTESLTTPSAYGFCSLTRIGPDFGNSDDADSYCAVDRNANGTWRLHGQRNDDPDFMCGMICFELGSGGSSSGGSGGGGITPQGTFTVPAGTTVTTSGVSMPFTATVSGANVGDVVVVGLTSNYYYGPNDTGGPTGLPAPRNYYNGQDSSYDPAVNVCGPVTATVSAPNTVKVNFWNNYENTVCTIPAGVYTVKVLR